MPQNKYSKKNVSGWMWFVCWAHRLCRRCLQTHQGTIYITNYKNGKIIYILNDIYWEKQVMVFSLYNTLEYFFYFW